MPPEEPGAPTPPRDPGSTATYRPDDEEPEAPPTPPADRPSQPVERSSEQHEAEPVERPAPPERPHEDRVERASGWEPEGSTEPSGADPVDRAPRPPARAAEPDDHEPQRAEPQDHEPQRAERVERPSEPGGLAAQLAERLARPEGPEHGAPQPDRPSGPSPEERPEQPSRVESTVASSASSTEPRAEPVHRPSAPDGPDQSEPRHAEPGPSRPAEPPSPAPELPWHEEPRSPGPIRVPEVVAPPVARAPRPAPEPDPVEVEDEDEPLRDEAPVIERPRPRAPREPEEPLPAVEDAPRPVVAPTARRRFLDDPDPDAPRAPRRPKVRHRKVRRIVRHIEPWSVLKISVLFFLSIFLIVCVASAVLWNAARSAGAIDDVESFITSLGFGNCEDIEADTSTTPETTTPTIDGSQPQLGVPTTDTTVAVEPEDQRSTIPDEEGKCAEGQRLVGGFEFEDGRIFQAFALGGVVLVLSGAAASVVMALLFNLISDLTGGMRVTVLEEESARPRTGSPTSPTRD